MLAGMQTTPPEAILELTCLLATVIDTIIQNELRLTNLRSDLLQQNARARSLTSIADRVQEGVMRPLPVIIIRSLNPAGADPGLHRPRGDRAGRRANSEGSDSLHAALAQAQKGEPVFDFGDAKFYRRDGEAFLAMLRIFPVLDEDRVEEILVFIQD